MDKLNIKILSEKNIISEIQAEKGENLLAILRKYGYFIDSPCNGNGTCNKCKVLININGDEKIVKSCDYIITENIEVNLDNLGKNAEIMSDYIMFDYEFGKYEKIYIENIVQSIKNNQSMVNILEEKLCKPLTITLNGEISLSNIENYENGFDVLLRNNEIIDAGQNIKGYGICIDIGTTTVVISLLDILKGKEIQVIKKLNPQKSYGADVISRIDYSIKNDNNILHKLIFEEITSGIDFLLNNNKIKENNVHEIVIAGNTTMTYLLLGINPKSLGKSPYTIMNKNIKAPFLFNGKYSAKVSILPVFSAFVGGDIFAGIYTTNMHKDNRNILFMDLGTNGEIGVKTGDKIFTSSTAAGPVFEGANISCGMASINGAITDVSYENGYVFKVIGNISPKGICGSALIDIVADLLNREIIDETGHFEDGEEIEICPEIFVTQKDIREVQLAKAAISAGLNIIVNEANIKMEQIDILYIGGGFGSNISIKNAVTIGLIPKILQDKTVPIGNCSLSGCIRFLTEKNQNNVEETIIKMCNHVELSACSQFNDEYIMNMMFEEME